MARSRRRYVSMLPEFRAMQTTEARERKYQEARALTDSVRFCQEVKSDGD